MKNAPDAMPGAKTISILNYSEHILILFLRPFRLLDLLLRLLQLLEADHLLLCILQAKMGVRVHGYSYFRMPHQILQCLRIHSGSCHIAAVGMAANVWSDVWNLHSVNLVVPIHHVVEAVFPVHGYQWEACFIYKKESRVAINHLLYFWLFSVLQDRLEAFENFLGHRQLPGTSVCLCSFNVKWSSSASYVL